MLSGPTTIQLWMPQLLIRLCARLHVTFLNFARNCEVAHPTSPYHDWESLILVSLGENVPGLTLASISVFSPVHPVSQCISVGCGSLYLHGWHLWGYWCT